MQRQEHDHDGLLFPLRAPESSYPLRVRTRVPLSDDALYRLCLANPDLRIERTAEGELIVMPPTGAKTSNRNSILTTALGVWTEKDGTGLSFDSNAGFLLPNGAERSPDASWVLNSRWDALTPEQQERFAPLCPDFVVELKSPSDKVVDLHAKMREYAENGARLGWLIDPESRRVWIYQSTREAACLEGPSSVSGDPVLPGFVLDVTRLW
jgi:Uma2 family endonuclease